MEKLQDISINRSMKSSDVSNEIFDSHECRSFKKQKLRYGSCKAESQGNGGFASIDEPNIKTLSRQVCRERLGAWPAM